MASMLSQNEIALLNLASDQTTVVNLLRKCGFPDKKWFELGLALELLEEDLNAIKTNNLLDVNDVNGALNTDGCLKQCISLWLLEGASFNSLLAALNSINETTVAKDLLKEIISSNSASKVRSETIKKTEEVAPSNDMLYNGIMHYEEKDLGHWLVKYTVSGDLDLLKQFLDNNPKTHYNVVNAFKYNQPDGILELSIQDTPSLESGWTVIPDRIPMEIHQGNVADNPLYSTCSMSVYAKPGIATAPLHCPIRLNGIDPEMTVFINLLPPLSSINSASSGSDISSETMRKTDEADISKWLKEGTVNLTVKRVQMLGPPGSGKTCSQRLLLNEDPPEEAVTDSTPIACRAVKATRILAHDDRMERVDAKALLSRLACDLKEAAAKQKETPTKDCGTKSQEESSETIPTDSPETKAIESPDISEPAVDPDVNKMCRDIVEAIPKAKANLNCNWVYIIDSGGQTAFQELLPLFTRASSFNIITIDLSKGLDEKLDLQYRIDGTPFSCDPTFSYTNIEFIKDVLSSGVILQPYHSPQSKETLRCPEYFILGTHKDKATQANIDEYNKELSSLNSGCDKKGYCIIPAEQNGDIIYPVNTVLKSGTKREAEAKDLCETIYDDVSGDLCIMPVRWFVFELTLLEKAEALNRTFLPIDDVLLAGKSLEMNEADTKEALQHLHNVTTILYYPQVLPDIVFVDPHPILDVLSRLLALTYKIDRRFLRHLTKERLSQPELKKLSEEGIFTESLLKKLKDDQEFSKSDFIKLLLHLHIIIDTEDGYFIPSALSSYTGLPPESDVVNPLVIVWHNPITEEILPVPRGIFPLVIVNLRTFKQPEFRFPTIDQKSTKATFTHQKYKYLRCRDAMSFCVFVHKEKIGIIHLIKKTKCVEIYFKGKVLKYCPLILEAVTEAINSSSIAINLKPNGHKLAFFCCSRDCYRIVTNETEEKVECLCDESDIISGQEKYWSWFHVTYQNPVTEGPKLLDIKDLKEILKLLREGHFNGDWEGLGIELGLYQYPTLSNIQHNCTKEGEAALRKCLTAWLQRVDAVDENGGATCVSLANALDTLGQKAVADHIRREYRIHFPQEETEIIKGTPHILDIIYLRDARSSLKKGNFDDSKWRDLGAQLCLLPDTLKTIEDDHSGVSRRLRETLVKWLEGADDALPSWGSLVKALEAIEENNAAEAIRCNWIKRKHT